jgi:hypothetical protein
MRIFTTTALGLALAAGLAAAGDAGWAEGRPTISEGFERGYYLWHDADGWHVRWTTAGGAHRFTGSVVAEGGGLEGLKRVDPEEEARILRPGRPARVVRGPRGRVHVRRGRAPVVQERAEDRVARDGDRRIVWSSRNDGDIDGFNFKVDRSVERLRFTFEVDGTSLARDVEVGRRNAQPPANPFTVDLR